MCHYTFHFKFPVSQAKKDTDMMKGIIEIMKGAHLSFWESEAGLFSKISLRGTMLPDMNLAFLD